MTFLKQYRYDVTEESDKGAFYLSTFKLLKIDSLI